MVLPSKQAIDLFPSIGSLSGIEQSKLNCWLDQDKLAVQGDNYWFLFTCEPRSMVLQRVSDYNPLLGGKALPLTKALNQLARDRVQSLVIEKRPYEVNVSTGNKLLKLLRLRQGSRFRCSNRAVRNFFGHFRPRELPKRRLCLTALSEQALIKPDKITAMSDSPTLQSVLVVGRDGAGFKCCLSRTGLRITAAAPAGSFSVHQFRNERIRVTAHCLERFQTRILTDGSSPLYAETKLFKHIKNSPVDYSFRMGHIVLFSINETNFVGAINRDKLHLVTVYPQTQIAPASFQEQLIALLQSEVLH
ncbi:MAG: hypothetical protein FH749_05695 [Firmicutes bacterium]|nr:hypothetical protein [Bacillota bacterium]